MLRLFIDKGGGGHSDLFLKIDVMLSHLEIADSYFLFDFLELSDEDFERFPEGKAKPYAATLLINYWMERIRKLEKGQSTFLLFDLSDQYIGGLTLEKVKRGYKMKTVYTPELYGWGVSKSTLDQRMKEGNVKLITSSPQEWLIGEEALFNGLNWSLSELAA